MSTMMIVIIVITAILSAPPVSGVYTEYSSAWKPNDRVTGTLTVPNGNSYGSWGNAVFCDDGYFLINLYEVKVEKDLDDSDDSAMNGLKLICDDFSRLPVMPSITPSAGPFGEWNTVNAACEQDYYGAKYDYFTSFALKVEAWQGGLSDDSSVNFIKFKCRDYAGMKASYEVSPKSDSAYMIGVESGKFGDWGTFGEWSGECPAGTAICGVNTKVEGDMGPFKDDTALNDVKFYCCNK